MSRWNSEPESYEERRAREREEERSYEGNVWYDVWRSGGNPDNVNPDRVSQAFHDGVSSENAAVRELRAQRQQRNEIEEFEPQQEETYPEENQ